MGKCNCHLVIEKLTLSSPNEPGFFGNNGIYSARTLLEIPLSALKAAQIDVDKLLQTHSDKVTVADGLVSLKGPVAIHLPPGRGVIFCFQAAMAAFLTAIIGKIVFALISDEQKRKHQTAARSISSLIGAAAGAGLTYLLTRNAGLGLVRFSSV